MLDYENLITDRALNVNASGIRKVFDLAAKLEDPINLSIGQPDFPVPDAVKQSAIDAINSNHNAYTVTQGIADLHNKIREKFNANFQTENLWQDYGVFITSGVSGGLLLALMSTVENGDEVIIPDPYFVMYKHIVTMVGGKSVYLDTYPDDFKLTVERLEATITDKTKVVFLSSPSNPTGVLTSQEEYKAIVELCEAKNILLISDEIYDEFCYAKVDESNGPHAPSPASCTENVLILRGFSKSYAMTGWRLGYAVGPKPIIEQMTKLQQFTFVCAPAPFQHACVTALDTSMGEEVKAYEAKRDMVIEKLSPQFELVKPDGAFYIFPKCPKDFSGTDFAKLAIENNVLIVPGNVFSEKDTHFRISYACDNAKLEAGLDILCKLAK